MSRVEGYLLIGLTCACLPGFAEPTILITMDSIEGASFSAHQVTARMHASHPGNQLSIEAKQVGFDNWTWRDLQWTCQDVFFYSKHIDCPHGKLRAGNHFSDMALRFEPAHYNIGLALRPSPDESWSLNGQGAPTSNWQLKVSHGQLEHLAGWLPQEMDIKPTHGHLTGSLSIKGDKDNARVQGFWELGEAAFSDTSGLRAGENVAGSIRLEAQRFVKAWHWKADVHWDKGEIYWQPLYFPQAEYRFQGHGFWDEQRIGIESGHFKLANIGELHTALEWDRKTHAFPNWSVRSSQLELTGFNNMLIKPFLEKTVFSGLNAAGQLELDCRYHRNKLVRAAIQIRGASFEDDQQRYSLKGVNATIPWEREASRTAGIHIQGGKLLGIPFGQLDTALSMRGLSFASPKLSLAVLDGRLEVNDLQASHEGNAWQWQFSSGLSPISMEQLSQALDWPTLHGTLSGVIPIVHYADHVLHVGGALLFKLFEGTVVAKDLSVTDALGPAPRLYADLDMRNLDLSLLTRTFSFGNMTGKVDAKIKGLELANWRPVKFDAMIKSSPGHYPRKISQTAVENISSLGGASASAAIQRSFLRYFDEFNYDAIGLSCRLSNGSCLMGGIENTGSGYTLVKGGGIPRISVVGYNRRVDWDVLLERLRRITAQNIKPVVR